MAFTYQYNVADTATTTDNVDGSTLEAEAIALGVTKAPVNPHVVRDGLTFTTTWAEDLVAAGQKGFLDAAVAAHTGVGASPPLEVTVAGPATDDGRQKVVVAAFAAGQETTFRGVGDDIATGSRNQGNAFRTKENVADTWQPRSWRYLAPMYLSEMVLRWRNGGYQDVGQYRLKAPPTPNTPNAGVGRYNVVGPKQRYEYAPAQDGAVDLDLTSPLNANVSFTEAVPVPNRSGTGWFDYDAPSNTLVVNVDQLGDYDLFGTERIFRRLATDLSLNADGEDVLRIDGDALLILPQWEHEIRIYRKSAGVDDLEVTWRQRTGSVAEAV